MSENQLPTYVVKILKNGLSGDAYLAPANDRDITEISALQSFRCDWRALWENADFDCEALVKMTHQSQIQGMVKFGLYPYPAPDGTPEFVEILNIESLTEDSKTVYPVGYWLIWYAVKICLEVGCSGDSSESVLFLISVKLAIPYYRDKVKMEGLRWTSLGPEEEGYAFRFSKGQAIEFLSRIENEYGQATEISE
jgi:hypothetical protein